MRASFTLTKRRKRHLSKEETSELQMVITGVGRSGTTFLAHCFLEAGSTMGSITPTLIGKGNCPRGGGLEHPLFVSINDQVMERLAAGEDPEDVSKIFSKLMRYPWPEVVKDPRFLETIHVWGAAGVHPERVFLCLRDTRAISQSTKEVWGWGEEMIQHKLIKQKKFLEYCARHGVIVTPVLFPRVALDQEYAQALLGGFISDPPSVIERVWNATSVRCEPEDEFIESERRHRVSPEKRKFEYQVGGT